MNAAEAAMREALLAWCRFDNEPFHFDDGRNIELVERARALTRAAFAATYASGEKAGITQASDSLARPSSSPSPAVRDAPKPCTCHPDDRPPMCMHRYAAGDCQKAYYNPIADPVRDAPPPESLEGEMTNPRADAKMIKAIYGHANWKGTGLEMMAFRVAVDYLSLHERLKHLVAYCKGYFNDGYTPVWVTEAEAALSHPSPPDGEGNQ